MGVQQMQKRGEKIRGCDCTGGSSTQAIMRDGASMKLVDTVVWISGPSSGKIFIGWYHGFRRYLRGNQRSCRTPNIQRLPSCKQKNHRDP